MADTRHFGLPLLAAAQAQKHVTVNEALARLDALAAGIVVSATALAPPEVATDGDVFLVPDSGETAWVAAPGSLAVWLNGGWVSATPRPGQRVWVRDQAVWLEHDGATWHAAGVAPAMGGHAALRSLTLDHDLGQGPVTAPAIPDGAVVFGVTGRVLVALAAAGAAGWRLGVEGAPGRYGSGYGLAAGSWARGLTGAPVAYWGETPLLVEGEGGAITAGRLRLCVHCLVLTPPAMV